MEMVSHASLGEPPGQTLVRFKKAPACVPCATEVGPETTVTTMLEGQVTSICRILVWMHLKAKMARTGLPLKRQGSRNSAARTRPK